MPFIMQQSHKLTISTTPLFNFQGLRLLNLPKVLNLLQMHHWPLPNTIIYEYHLRPRAVQITFEVLNVIKGKKQTKKP